MDHVMAPQEIAEALAELDGWGHDEARRAIARRFVFRDFAQAFSFMTAVALAAEEADHHPDWSNSWNKVDILLTTHSAGGVTARDVALARRIDAAASLALGAAPH